MKEVYRRERAGQMKAIWESFEWLLEEKLISIDNMTRAMMAEMKTVSVPDDMIAEYLPQQFLQLKERIVAEQNARYEKDVKNK
ncbi:hypothetical protein [Paenibacillus sedimenti]|uniref:Uncharacterized protein n=1 Tax=Paenibacillus sedimenti TaxID=2770274 RepID=A0A926KQD1_9BACL|nr:hypothetical protein [Paenibacillus sedimenti]MBD0381226.1 hypothetical protein [Paenibacillus sedimenti]